MPLLGSLFADHAILQRDQPIAINGTADAGERVVVMLGNERRTTRADANGGWRVRLGARSASAIPVDLVVEGEGGTSVRAREILVGDVWLCSGQSNMEMQVERALNSYNEVKAANDPLLRLVTVPRATAETPERATATPLRWNAVTPETLGAFSAVCYYMARALRASQEVPVGAIAASWGGTKIVPWLAGGAINNGMIAPIAQYGVKGIAWYQGESDVGSEGYRERLRELMSGWRTQFRQPDMPFLVVGLANFGPHATRPVTSSWAELREEQRLAVAGDAHAALIPAFDVGERSDIHPANKQAVGQRLALAAGALVYAVPASALPGVKRAARSPTGDIVISFDNVAGALESWSGAAVLGFELCGRDRAVCRFAFARASGADVVIHGDGTPAEFVRYGWADSPVVNLYDTRALPPGPFQISVDPR